MSCAPCPETPIPAMFNRSLGGFSPPRPKTRAGTTCTVAAHKAAFFRKLRRLRPLPSKVDFIACSLSFG